MFKRFVLLCILTLGTLGSHFAQNQFYSASSLLQKTRESIAQVHTLSYTSTVWERLRDASINESEMRVKVQSFPLKVYFYNIFPNEGMEVLYDSEKDKHKALINTNGFPWVNIRLDIHGKLVREGKHQTVERAGYRFIGDFLNYAEKYLKEAGTFDQACTYQGQVDCQGLSCHLVVLEDPNYSLHTYIAKEGEDVISIARKFHLNEYKILDLNPQVSNYFDVKAGMELLLPSAFAKKTHIYLHPETFLITQVEMFDEKGLFERYGYLDVTVNPSFSENEFTDEFEGYGF